MWYKRQHIDELYAYFSEFSTSLCYFCLLLVGYLMTFPDIMKTMFYVNEFNIYTPCYTCFTIAKQDIDYYYYVLYNAIFDNISCTLWRDNISVTHCNTTRVYMYILNMLQVGIWTRNTHIFIIIQHVHQTENTLSFSPFVPLV